MLRIFRQYYPIRNAFFIFGEGIFIFVSVILACRLLVEQGNDAVSTVIVVKALLITSICQACLYYNDLYDLEITGTLVELTVRLLQALGASAIILAFVYSIFPHFIIGRGVFILSVGFLIVLIVSWRIGYTHILKKGLFNQKIILLGSSDMATEIAKEIYAKKDCGYEIASVITKNVWPELECDISVNVSYQNYYENICEKAQAMGVTKIVVVIKEKRGSFPINELLKCRVNGIDILDGNTFYEMLTGKLIVEHINPSWLIFSSGFQKPKWKKIAKRITDLVISLTLLIIFRPFIVLTQINNKLDSKGPVFFSQERVGENCRPYMVHKFRSMRSDAEKETGPVWAADNDDRITRVGSFIRKWRVDEIPQLWNVLKGEMSFVGPRPEREHFVKELAEIIPYYDERFSVKPGLTGWAQVSYGYGASVRDAIEKLNYELFYIKNMSILLDMMIIAKTVKTVLFGMGR